MAHICIYYGTYSHICSQNRFELHVSLEKFCAIAFFCLVFIPTNIIRYTYIFIHIIRFVHLQRTTMSAANRANVCISFSAFCLYLSLFLFSLYVFVLLFVCVYIIILPTTHMRIQIAQSCFLADSSSA